MSEREGSSDETLSQVRCPLSDLVCLHDKADVETFTRINPFLYLYLIGDLDDFFWPHTTWYALRDGGQVRQLVLLYSAQSLPVVLALTDPPIEGLRDLLRTLLPFLPKRFYAHLTEGVEDVLAGDYRIQPHGIHDKMGLTDRVRLAGVDASEAVPLCEADVDDLQALYAASYPGNWFDPRMLETGFYQGIRRNGALVSVAGVHVVSQTYRVAALGNITTRPDVRGQGLATVVTARLCQELLRAGIEHIGLNVKADNPGAIACYERIGFERVGSYGEFTLELP
jgi:ribosomal protein S18 acetylase RimI-like enzyme